MERGARTPPGRAVGGAGSSALQGPAHTGPPLPRVGRGPAALLGPAWTHKNRGTRPEHAEPVAVVPQPRGPWPPPDPQGARHHAVAPAHCGAQGCRGSWTSSPSSRPGGRGCERCNWARERAAFRMSWHTPIDPPRPDPHAPRSRRGQGCGAGFPGGVWWWKGWLDLTRLSARSLGGQVTCPAAAGASAGGKARER